jgi:hypothetical protein
MNCQEIQKSLSSYLERLLSSEEKKFVEGHLSSCAQCRDSLAELKKTKDLLRNLDDVEPPPWLTAKIMARVRDEKEQRANFLKKLFFPFHIKVPLQALSVILVGVIVFQVYRLVEPEKNVTHAPSPPSLVAEKKEMQEETPPDAAKSAEAPSSRSQQNTTAGKVAVKKDENAQPISGAQGRGVQKPGNVSVPAGESAPVMAQSAPEEKSKKEVAGLANAPRQTEPSGQRTYGGTPEDAEKTTALLDKKGTGGEPGTPVPAETVKQQPSYANQQPMPLIIVSAHDSTAAKKIAEDMVKQLGGKEIETMTQGTIEIMIAELPSEKIKELSEKLKSLGEIKVEPRLSDLPEGTFRVRIEITPQ